MKKLLLGLVFLLALTPNTLRAQVYDCSTITSSNYGDCCITTSANSDACSAYRPSAPSSGQNSPQPISGSFNGTTGNYCNPVPGTNAPACCSNGTNITVCQHFCNIQCPASNIPGMVSGGTPSVSPSSGDLLNNSRLASTTTTNSPALRACSAIKFVSLLDIVIWVKCIIVGALLPLLFSVAFLYFLWGVFKFMQAREQKDRESAKQRVIWGLVGMFVMVSIWGIINIASNTLGIQNTVPLLQTDYLSTDQAHH